MERSLSRRDFVKFCATAAGAAALAACGAEGTAPAPATNGSDVPNANPHGVPSCADIAAGSDGINWDRTDKFSIEIHGHVGGDSGFVNLPANTHGSYKGGDGTPIINVNGPADINVGKGGFVGPVACHGEFNPEANESLTK